MIIKNSLTPEIRESPPFFYLFPSGHFRTCSLTIKKAPATYLRTFTWEYRRKRLVNNSDWPSNRAMSHFPILISYRMDIWPAPSHFHKGNEQYREQICWYARQRGERGQIDAFGSDGSLSTLVRVCICMFSSSGGDSCCDRGRTLASFGPDASFYVGRPDASCSVCKFELPILVYAFVI